MKKILLLFTLFSFTISSYAQSPIILSIKHKLGTENYSPITTSTAELGYEFNAKRIQYYISNIKLIHDGGMETLIDEHFLIDAAHDFIGHLGNPDINTFEGIKYSIGVDESLNHLDPTTYDMDHPLAPQNPNMHWGWTSGYKFAVIEGAAGDGLVSDYEIHGLGDDNYFETNPEINWYYQTQTSFAPIVIDIHADYINALKGIDTSNGLIEHGFNDEARDLLVNFRDNIFGPGDGSPLSNETIIDNNVLTITPNPASQYTRIELKDYDGDFTMQLRDFTGKKILSKTMQSRDQYLDLSTFANGIYFVQLFEAGDLIATQKLVVTK